MKAAVQHEGELPRRSVICAGAVVGLLFSICLYGARIVDPRSAEWLMGESDPLQHFLGWDFFRRDVWRFPLGSNPTFGTLADSSIVYSDSSPLLAIVLKPFSFWLPDPLQYLGLLLCFNFAASGGAAAALAFRLTGQALTAVAFSALTVALPLATLVSARSRSSLRAPRAVYAGHPAVLVACTIIQAVDLAPWHAHVRAWARRDVPPWPVLSDPLVMAAFEGRRAVSVLPPGALAQVPPFAWMAARHGLSINTAPYARMSARVLQERASTELQYVRAGQLDPATVYVLAEERLVEDTCALDGVRCHRVSTGGAVAVVSSE